MAKKWFTNAKRAFAEKLELPSEVFLDIPRITMIGHLHIYIENHKGLINFTNNELRLHMKNGQLLVRGDNFVIKTVLADEILLEGEIHGVSFLNEETK